MIECDDDFELNLSFGGGGGGGSEAKSKPKETRKQAAPPPAREKVMLRRQTDPSSSSSTSSVRPSNSNDRSNINNSSRSSSSGSASRTVSAKSLRRVPDPSTGKLNTTTGLVQHKVPVIGNKVKSTVPGKAKLKTSGAAGGTETETGTWEAKSTSTSSTTVIEKKKSVISALDDPMQYHARPSDLSKDAPALGNVKQAMRSEYIFTRQSFAALNMPAKVVELLEKDFANGECV